MASNSTAPPPLDPSQLPHDTQQPNIIMCIIFTWVVAALAVYARFYTKISISRAKPAASEWCLISALIFSLATSICQFIQVQCGMGAHIWDLTPLTSNAVRATEAQWISIIFYALSLALTKCSILILFLGIFIDTWTRIATYIVLALVILSNIWVFYVIFSACTPIEAFWDISIRLATCHPQAYWLSNQGLIIVTDCLVFLLPMPVVWPLKMRMTQKVLVLFLFSMGLFICVVSIIRIAVLQPVLLDAGQDVTYNVAPIFYWTSVEMNASIAVGCCITLKPLFSRIFPRLLGSSQPSDRVGSDGSPAGPNKTVVTIGSGGPHDQAILIESRLSAEVNSNHDLEMGDLRKQHSMPSALGPATWRGTGCKISSHSKDKRPH